MNIKGLYITCHDIMTLTLMQKMANSKRVLCSFINGEGSYRKDHIVYTLIVKNVFKGTIYAH